jgi:ribosomal protein L11 methyltransferase
MNPVNSQNQTQQNDRLTWLEARFTVKPEHEDLACWLVVHCGARGSHVEAEESGLAIKASFDLPQTEDTASAESSKIFATLMEPLRKSFEEYGLSYALPSLKWTEVAEEDWLATWKQGLEPFAVGDKFLICPPWSLDQLDKNLQDRILLIIEPGMAFGTGLHETTKYCLNALAKFGRSGRILDIGTGSGILAIAAKKLFPDAIICGVDTDPLAVRTANENLELNSVSGQIELKLGSTEVLAEGECDLVLSNLTMEDNAALLPEYRRLLKNKGLVIASGILKEKLPALLEAAKLNGFAIVDQFIDGNWAGVTFQKH